MAEEQSSLINCSDCSERIDKWEGAARMSYCGMKIPAQKYPVLTAGCAPYWCPRRPSRVSSTLSGVCHIYQDYSHKYRCSMCGKVIVEKDGQKHCPACESGYVN